MVILLAYAPRDGMGFASDETKNIYFIRYDGFKRLESENAVWLAVRDGFWAMDKSFESWESLSGWLAITMIKEAENEEMDFQTP